MKVVLGLSQHEVRSQGTSMWCTPGIVRPSWLAADVDKVESSGILPHGECHGRTQAGPTRTHTTAEQAGEAYCVASTIDLAIPLECCTVRRTRLAPSMGSRSLA